MPPTTEEEELGGSKGWRWDQVNLNLSKLSVVLINMDDGLKGNLLRCYKFTIGVAEKASLSKDVWLIWDHSTSRKQH